MNGEKTIMKDEHEFDSWSRAAAHYQPTQAMAATNPSASATSDGLPYGGMSYYHTAATQHMFPYSAAAPSAADHMQPSSQPWSNGAEPMTFLGGYTAADHNAGQHSGHYTMEAMFGSQSTYGFGSPFNAFFPSGSAADPFWGNNTKNRANAGLGAPPGGPTGYRMHDTQDSYGYHHDSYATGGMGDGGVSLKHVESGMAGLTLDHIKASEQFNSAKSGPFSGSEPKKFDSIGSSSGAVGQVPKKMTWASIASQPAKPQPKSLKSKMSSSVLTGSTSKHLPPTSMEAIGTWESKNGSAAAVKTPPVVQTAVPQPPTIAQRSVANSVAAIQPVVGGSASSSSWVPSSQRQVSQQQQQQQQQQTPSSRTYSGNSNSANSGSASSAAGDSSAVPLPAHPVLDKLRVENNYNPKEFDLNPRNARFFIIKSYSEDDIHRSIKYSIWCSTEHGNKRLDNAFKQQESKGPIYLLYSVNGSGHFCGMAQMMSYVDYNCSSNVWAQDKWKGQFKVKWIYVKDVPNAQLRHIRLENNENKPVTNSRDTQEVPFEKGKQVIKIMHHFRHTTSIFDDFLHYEKRQEEESQRRVEPPGPGAPPPPPPINSSGHHRASHVDNKRPQPQLQQHQQQWKN